MKTYLECIPCFLSQAKKIMDLNKVGPDSQEKILKKIMLKLTKADLNKTPPEFALFVYKTIEEETKNNDLYKKIKKNDNKTAEKMVPQAKKIAENSSDKLETLIRLAICGNIMDFAANQKYDISDTIEKNINKKFAVNNYSQLKKEILKAESIAYLADNAGEIIFDRLLIEEISRISKAQINLFVRGKPIINDVTEKEAKALGFEKIPRVKIMKTETVFPFISKSKALENTLKKHDLIISKGQANYECLSELDANIYFLLITKCEVIARNIRVKKHGLVLMKQKP